LLLIVEILIDAQLPPGLKLMLVEAGHDSLRSSKSNRAIRMTHRCGDTPSSNETLFLTKDEDFAVRRLREPHSPTIILLRVGNCSRAALVWLTPLLGSIEALVAAGETVIEVR
jgi:predicted nuclease of predicted toxin-antitoxin system